MREERADVGSFDPAALLAAARRAAEGAYAPYSGFRVGAALLAASGRLYTAGNVENAAYPLSLCAETAAVGCAVAAGERRFLALAVAEAEGRPCRPCGACRQVLAEFSPCLVVVTVGEGGEPEVVQLDHLLPRPFRLGTAMHRGGDAQQ
ncbi:MAG: cytidine deaminase [Clostridia bacterium]|nr:cytidine deaminase [Clostridia bacterium]